jgi:hypothetical protein
MADSIYYDGEVNVHPALTEEDAATFRELVTDTRTDRTKPFFDLAANPESQVPYYTGLLELNDDEDQILPETEDSRPGAGTWLQLVVKHFLAPKGYTVEGEIKWRGDDPEDRGCIYAKGQQVEVVDDRIENPGPSWAPTPYASDGVKEAISDLVDSADDAGCSDDLTVVSAATVEALNVIYKLL